MFGNPKIKKFLAIMITTSVVLTYQLIPTKTADAFLGFGDIVSDPIHTLETIAGWVGEGYQWLIDKGLDIALQALKKRVLDTMTDQIVNWINGGGEPRFTQDFGSVFREAGDAAVGDVLQQEAATNVLCQPFAFDITLQLQKPPLLSKQVTCSLLSVIKSFDDYRNNFKSGGWLAYQELLKPQNNQWGVEIITQSEIINRTTQKTNENVLKQHINVGFNSERCTDGWYLIDTRTGVEPKTKIGSYVTKLELIHDGPAANDDPSKPPKSPGDNLAYTCKKKEVTTPGRAIATGLEKSLYSGLDLVISAKDLTNYLAIIADAAFNRLIKVGADGLGKIGQSSTNDQNLREAAAGYQNTQNQASDNVRSTYLRQLKQASDALAFASSTLESASAANKDIVSVANGLIACSLSPDDKTFAKNAISTAESTQKTILIKSIQWNGASSNVKVSTAVISSATCDMTCLNQNKNSVSDAANAANSLNIDANNILLEVQAILSDLQGKMKVSCKT